MTDKDFGALPASPSVPTEDHGAAVVARWPVRVSWIYEHTHRGQRTQMAGTYGLTTTNTKAEGFEAVLDEIERQSEWILKRSPNTKTVITITLDADTPTTASAVGTKRSEVNQEILEEKPE